MWTNQQREILMLRYLSALENGEPDTIAEILTQAETDPMLERMIRDLHAHLAPHEQAAPTPKYPEPNGHYPSAILGEPAILTSPRQRKETQPMTTMALDRPRYDPPWTLIATAMLIVVVSGITLLSLGLDLPDPAPDGMPSANTMAALQSTDSAGATIATGDDCTLADAITAANTDTAVGACPAGEGDDTITLIGDILLTEIDNESEETGANGLPVITSTITIEGAGFMVERDEDAPLFRIFMVDEAGTLTLNDIVVSGGHLNEERLWHMEDQPQYNGGGVLNYGATLTISNSTFSGNAAFSGGGIYSDGITTTLENTVLSGNAAAHGGAIYTVSGTVTLSGSTFSGNSAAEGGGLYNDSGDVTVSDSVFSGNNAATGAGLDNQGGLVTITNGTFSGNNAATGAGIYNHSGSVNLTNNTFSGNDAASGAGLYNHGGEVTVSTSTFAGNNAMEGAGVVNHEGTLTVQDSVFTGNTAMHFADIQGAANESGNNFTGGSSMDNFADFNFDFSFDFPMVYQECIQGITGEVMEGFGEEGFHFELPEDFPEVCIDVVTDDFMHAFPEECRGIFPEIIWEDFHFQFPEDIPEECIDAFPEAFPEVIWEDFHFEWPEDFPEECIDVFPENFGEDGHFEWPEDLPDVCVEVFMHDFMEDFWTDLFGHHNDE